MTTNIKRQIRLVLLIWTCILQNVHSSSVAISTSPIISSITSAILSTSVDSVVTTSVTCIGCDDTSVYCTTTGTVTECLDAAVVASIVTETIYETNVVTRTTVVGLTVGFTTIYSNAVGVATSLTSNPSSVTVLPAAITSSTAPTNSDFQTEGAVFPSTRKTLPANASITETSTTLGISGPMTTIDNGVSSPPSSNGMSTGTKAALGAAVTLGAILVGAGVFLLIKRRNQNIKPPLAVFAEPSTDPEKSDDQPNRFFFTRQASRGKHMATTVVSDRHELDGQNADKQSAQHIYPHEVEGSPVYLHQSNRLYETGGQGRYETAGNPRYEIHG